jgi:hypothetical protein
MNNIKIVLAFLVGAATGAFATYQFLDKKYEERADEEIESIREFANKRIKEAENRANDNIDYDQPTVIKRRTKADNNYEHTHTDYNSIYKSKEPLSSVAERLHRVPDPVETQRPTDDEPKPVDGDGNILPYIISMEDYSDTHENFDKLNLTYYDEDDTLADENEEIVTDVEATIGFDSLSCFGENDDDKDTIYVRNERLGADFEVNQVHQSYSEMVLGIVKGEEKIKVKRRHENMDCPPKAGRRDEDE